MSAKVRKIIGILDKLRVKYLFSAALLPALRPAGVRRVRTPERVRRSRPGQHPHPRFHSGILPFRKPRPKFPKPSAHAANVARRHGPPARKPAATPNSKPCRRRSATRCSVHSRSADRPPGRLAGRQAGRHRGPRLGQAAAQARRLPRRSDFGQEQGLALLRRTQPHGLYLQPRRHQLPEHESQGRFHAGQYGRQDHLRTTASATR